MGLPYINITFSNVNGVMSRVVAEQHRFLADRELAFNESESPFRYMYYGFFFE